MFLALIYDGKECAIFIKKKSQHFQKLLEILNLQLFNLTNSLINNTEELLCHMVEISITVVQLILMYWIVRFTFSLMAHFYIVTLPISSSYFIFIRKNIAVKKKIENKNAICKFLFVNNTNCIPLIFLTAYYCYPCRNIKQFLMKPIM